MIATIYEHGSFVFFLYVCISMLLGLFGLSDVAPAGFWKGTLTIAFEVSVGAGVTILFIDRFNAHRERESLKRRLIREAGSRSHDVAISAIEWMEREGWLRGEDGLLKGADLREAQLKDAWMDGANLDQAELRKADLRSTRIQGAWFRSAQLPEARLYRAKLNGAKMRFAYLHSAFAERADFSRACLKDATLDWLCLRDAILMDACFKGASLHTADLRGASLLGANFDNADLSFAKLREAEYHNKASWEKVKLVYVDLSGVDFSHANMKGANFECANLEGVDYWGTDLQGANLRGARLKDAKFNVNDGRMYAYAGDTPPAFEDLPDDEISRKTNWVGATLPDGTVFTEDMDYKEILRFTSPHDPRFCATLAGVEAYRNRL